MSVEVNQRIVPLKVPNGISKAVFFGPPGGQALKGVALVLSGLGQSILPTAGFPHLEFVLDSARDLALEGVGVLAMDHPRHGLNANSGELSIASCVDIVQAGVDFAAGLRQPETYLPLYIKGYSYGALVAAQVSAHYPGVFRRTILGNPPVDTNGVLDKIFGSGVNSITFPSGLELTPGFFEDTRELDPELALALLSKRALIIQGVDDQYINWDRNRQTASEFGLGFIGVPGNHEFKGSEGLLRKIVLKHILG